MNFPSKLRLSSREAVAWVLVVILSIFCFSNRHLHGTKFHNVYKTGGNCLCSPDDYCMCTPSLAIDVIIETGDGSVVLVRRADNGKYATIGGFVDIGESVEATVARELLEETGLALQEGSTQLMGVYSDPRRDHRRHTVSAVYVAHAASLAGLKAGDDAKAVEVIKPEKLLGLDFAFDHHVIVSDYLHAKSNPAAVIRPDWKRSTCFGGSSGFHS